MKNFKCVLWAEGIEIDYYISENESKEKMIVEAAERFYKAYPLYANCPVTVEEV